MVIKTILLLADGFEEVEAVTLIDVLRRGSISVVLAKVGGGEGLVVKGAHEISLTADVHLLDIVPLIDEFAALLLPGGGQAAQTFCTDMDTQKLLRLADRKGMLIGAICAAPRALHAAGVYLGYKLTSYPLFASELSASYEYIDEEGKDVVVHENKLVTSRGPATAMPFALELVRLLAGEHEASLVAEQLLFK